MALRNKDLNAEIWKIINDQHWRRVDLASRLDMYPSGVQRYIDACNVKPALIRLMEVLGYDVEVKFVRRNRGSADAPEAPEVRKDFGGSDPMRRPVNRPAPHGLDALTLEQAEDLRSKLDEVIEKKKSAS